MKLKADFVTNSSSTSFIAWGIWWEDYQFKKENDKALVILNNENNPDNPILTAEGLEVYELGELICNGNDLSNYHDYDGDCIQIGISPFQMKDDETLTQLKERVVKQLKEKGIIKTTDDVKPQTYCGYNG